MLAAAAQRCAGINREDQGAGRKGRLNFAQAPAARVRGSVHHQGFCAADHRAQGPDHQHPFYLRDSVVATLGIHISSKHSIEAFGDSLAGELAPNGVTVSPLNPGNINSDIGATAAAWAGPSTLVADRSNYPEPVPSPKPYSMPRSIPTRSAAA
ncbi:MAG: hypothetical protein MEQ07_03330 [Aquimonas sp.]|nr:hypothetical protein [Aquimonas sp.]